MGELWKQVPFASKYEASNHGRVRNINTKKILRQSISNNGYYRVCLRIHETRSLTRSVHQIIARTFIDNPENKITVNHIDHNKLNNRVDNLEWMTVTEQNRYSANPKLPGGEHGVNSCRPVWKCDIKTGERIEKYESLKLAALSVTNTKDGKSKICAVCRKRIAQDGRGKQAYLRKSAYGFKWEYEESTIIDEEIWKDINPKYIKGVTGYSISSDGRIKNHKGRVGEPYGHPNYLWHSIHPHQFMAHRLVALVFIENPDSKLFVNHIDGDKTNCNLSNLEWVTPSENSQHAVDTNLLNNKRNIYQYNMDGTFVSEYESIVNACKNIGLDNISVKNITSGGYQWRYCDDTRPIENIENIEKKLKFQRCN